MGEQGRVRAGRKLSVHKRAACAKAPEGNQPRGLEPQKGH